jgi:uncharacterized tellurite resistance protein B-like protein
MFADFLNRLFEPDTPALTDTDARLALSALLVRLARSDGHYDRDEIAHIEAIATRRYGLPQAEAKTLREDAEALEAEAPDTIRFTTAIKEAVPYEERAGVVEALWEVALSDGRRDAQEDALIRMAASFLGVCDRDSALARQRVSRD